MTSAQLQAAVREARRRWRPVSCHTQSDYARVQRAAAAGLQSARAGGADLDRDIGAVASALLADLARRDAVAQRIRTYRAQRTRIYHGKISGGCVGQLGGWISRDAMRGICRAWAAAAPGLGRRA